MLKILNRSVVIGTIQYYAGQIVDDSAIDVAPFAVAGVLLLDATDPVYAAAAARCARLRLRGSSGAELDFIMGTSIDVEPVAGGVGGPVDAVDVTYDDATAPAYGATDVQGALDAAKALIAAAGGSGPPLAHAASHATGGTDPVSPASIGAEVAGAAAAAIVAHVAAVDPHPSYMTPAEGAVAFDAIGAATAAVGTHVGLADPHAQYLLETDAATTYAPVAAPAAAVATHVGLADPHAQYLLETDAAATYEPIGAAAAAVAAHVGLADPHAQYLTEAAAATTYAPIGSTLGVGAVQTTSFTAVSGTIHPVDVTGGAIAVAPPGTPVAGDTFEVCDATSNAVTNNITIAFTGASVPYNGTATDAVILTPKGHLRFVYVNGTIGWMEI